MLEEKKARGSRERRSGNPKSSRIGSSGSFNSTAGNSSNGAIDSARRFALLSERCAPTPAPGPLTAPLFGGLTGGSLLIGQQAVSLRLTQLKAQIALTQINNALAVGSRAATLTANSNTPASYISSKPPSPTAAAINLLNLLKIANTMSHPLYNPYASGNQSSTQGQYGLSNVQAERDPRGASSHLGPGSGFSSSGTSSMTPTSSGGMFPSLLPQSLNYRPEQCRTMVSENMERSTEMNVSRAREQAGLLGKPVHQPVDQGTHFTSNQRDEFLSSGTRMPPYPMSSTSDSLGHRHAGVASSSASLDWSSNYTRPTADEPPVCYSSSASSSYASVGDTRFNTSRERVTIPGLGDFDKPAAPTKSSQPMYTSELATDILKNFGLEKEDLEHLLSFPEDQITPSNLPFILRQIRAEKTKRETTAVQSRSCPEPQPTRNVGGMDSRSLSGIGGAAINQEEVSTSVLRPSKVIDYGHTGKYTGGVGDETGRTGSSRVSGSGSMLLMDTYDGSRYSREQPQQSKTEMKSSTSGSSHEQGMSVSGLSSPYSSILSSVTPSSSDKMKGLQTQPSKTPPTTASQSFGSLPKEDSDLRILKSEAPKHIPVKKTAEDCQSTSKPQPSSHLYRGVHPSRPGLVVIGSNDTSGTKDQSRSQEQGSTGAVQMKKQPKKQQEQPMQQKQQTKMPPVTPTGNAMWPPVFSAEKPVPPTSHIPTITDVMQHTVFIPGDRSPMVIPPAQPMPIPNVMGLGHPTPPPSDGHPLVKMVASKGLPTATMMQDYAAATPRIFPHTCTLCNRKCADMKDWLSHQNTNLHLESCKLLRKQYPDWDGEIAHTPRATGKDPKPSPSASSQTSKHRHQKVRHESSSSHSPSPHHHHGSRGRREKRRSRSRSPYSSRHTRRSRSRSHSPWYERHPSSQHPSRSWSPDLRPLPGRRDDRRLSPRRSREGRSPPRRSNERRLSPWKNDPRLSPPWRIDVRQSPPWRSDVRLSPPWKSDPRKSPPRRKDVRRSPPRRTDGPSQRKKPNATESLAKRLLETPELQSLSNQPNLEAVIKTLTPVLAQLVKMKPSSPSSAASSSPLSLKSKKKVLKKPFKAKPSLQKSEGEVKVGVQDTASKEQKKPLQKKPVTSSPSTHPTATTQKVLLPTPKTRKIPPLLSIDTHLSKDKLNIQKSAAKSSVKGKTIATKAKVLVSKVKAKEITKKTGKLLTEKEALKKDAVKPATSSGSKSRAPQMQLKTSKPKESESKEQEVAPRDTAEVAEKRSATVVEAQPQADLGKANDAGDTEPMEIGEIGVEVSEPMELGGCAEGQTQKPAATEAVPENSPEKSTESQPPNSPVETPPTETSAKALPHVQQSTLSEPESTTPGSETRTEAAHMDLQAAESQIIDDVVAKQPGGKLIKETILKDPLDAVEAEMDSASVNDDSKSSAVGHLTKEPEGCAEGQEQKPATTEAVPENSPEKSTESQPPNGRVETPPTETSAKALPHIQQSISSGPESTTPGSETRTEAAHMDQQAAESQIIDDVVAKQPGGKLIKETILAHPTKEPEGCAEGQEQKTATTEAVPENSPEKSTESQPPNSTVETPPTETSAKPLPHIQQSTLSEPESTTPGSETRTETAHVDQQAAESQIIEVLDAKQLGEKMETETTHKAPVNADQTETDAAAAAANEVSRCLSAPHRTKGEMLNQDVLLSKIHYYRPKSMLPPMSVLKKKRQLLIYNLPDYNEDSYTKEELAGLLRPFGFEYTEENIYVLPQAQMAIAFLPKKNHVLQMMNVDMKSYLAFKKSKVTVNLIRNTIMMPPVNFYKILMKMAGHVVLNDGLSTVLIKNISWNKTRELRESLDKIGFITNFLPLLNKVFVEFASIYDADRLGVSYSLLRQPPGYEIHRLKMIPTGPAKLRPRHCKNVLPYGKDSVAVFPPLKFGLPQGITAPFWLAMNAHPFVFPTSSPWFIIPKYLTVSRMDDIETASRGSKIPTIMLTGLPSFGGYSHEDVAQLVWQYFPEQNLHSLYYNVVVLTLQRRAFLFFPDWKTCCDFARKHITNPVYVKGFRLSVHFILEALYPATTEEAMFTSLMKLNNAVVPDPESLQDRLLSVEISVTSIEVIKKVSNAVASIATFVSFLPLANRICFEMADASDVTKVLDKYSMDAWKTTVLTMKSLKQYLKDSSETTINLELSTASDQAKPQTVTQPPAPEPSHDGSQPSPSTSGPGESSIKAGPRLTATRDVAMKETEDGEKSEEGSLTTSVSSSDVTSASAVSSENKVSEEKPAEIPQMNTDTIQALLDAVRKHRQARESMSHREEDRIPYKSKPITRPAAAYKQPPGQGYIDFTEDVDFLEGGMLFNGPKLSRCDFVTVDEVGDEFEDQSAKHHHSSTSRRSSGAGKGRQSSSLSSTSKSTSTRSSQDSASSSKTTKGSSPYNSSSSAPKKSKHSSEPTKSSTKPLTSTSASKTSSSSSSHKSTETSSSPGQKPHMSKTSSPTKASNAASSARSSSAAHESQNRASAVTAEASLETQSELPKDKAKAKRSVVAKSDHRVSAEDISAKTVESGTKIESSTEMHPPQQGHGLELSQGQAKERGFNKDTSNDQKKSKGEMKHEVDEHTELEKGEKYLILDSCDQIDDQNNVDQVLDSVTEEKVSPGQEDSSLVQNSTSTEKQQFEKDTVSAVKGVKDQEANNVNNFQVLDAVRQASRDSTDGKKRNEAEVKILPAECCSASEDVENTDHRIPNDEQNPQNLDNGDTLKAADGELPEQETFEVLDSIDDQTAAGDDLETPSDPKSKEDVQPVEEEEDAYQVIDSVEDQPTTTETESETDKKGKRNPKDERPSRRTGPTTRTSKSEEKDKSPKKQDKTAKIYATRKKMDSTARVSKKDEEVTEDMVYEIIDSVEEEQVQAVAASEMSVRRRSTRGKKEDKITKNLTEVSEKPEEASYEILDSVEDETAADEPTVTTRSTRGKKERTDKDSSHEKAKEEDTPTRTTRRRKTPAGESQEQIRGKTPNNEEKAPPKERTPSRRSDKVVRESIEEDATYDVVDSVEDESIKNDQPTARRKGQRGRPKKDIKTTKIDNATSKESKNDAFEKVSDEEEATYQIIDSVEDELIANPPLTGKTKDKASKNKNLQPGKTSSLTGPPKKEEEEEEEPMYQILDSLEDDQVQEELAATLDQTKDETPLREEESVEKQLAKEQEARRTEERERRSRSRGKRGGDSGVVTRRAKEEPEEVDTKELVTLDEVGADEAGEERREWDEEITEGELSALVTLDEFVEEEEEEEEDGEADKSKVEVHPPSQEEELVDLLNPETLVTLDEAVDDEDEKPEEEQTEKASTSAKRKHEDDTEDSVNFVTVDEVGEAEEEEEKEPIQSRTRGQARKRTRQTPVRKSTRGKNVTAKDEEEERSPAGTDPLPPNEASSSVDKNPSTLSSHSQPETQKTEAEVGASNQADHDAASAGVEPQLELPETQSLEESVEEGEEEKEGWSKADSKVLSKKRRDPAGPEAKRSRSRSPCVTANVKLPALNPLGQEFVVPTSGFFCNLCSLFYLNERSAMDLHCSSQRHHDNLQKHFQNLQQKPPRSSSQSS